MGAYRLSMVKTDSDDHTYGRKDGRLPGNMDDLDYRFVDLAKAGFGAP